MTVEHYTYRVTWSAEDGEYAGTCAEFPSLSWLAADPDAAFAGIRTLVRDTVAEMAASGETPPQPLADRHYSGRFQVRVPPDLHRRLAREAAEANISLNHLVTHKLENG